MSRDSEHKSRASPKWHVAIVTTPVLFLLHVKMSAVEKDPSLNQPIAANLSQLIDAFIAAQIVLLIPLTLPVWQYDSMTGNQYL